MNAIAGEAAARHQQRLLIWLIDAACPLWSTYGVDRVHGGFHERLDGRRALEEPRRERVQPRQVSAFANAAVLGWTGDAAELVRHGLSYLRTHYRRPDGLYRTLVAPDGRAIDDRALLYDQGFVLLGLADSRLVLGPLSEFTDEARSLRRSLYLHLKRADSGFESELSRENPLSANAHMHLFEAALAWLETSDDPEWRTLANEIGNLALTRLIDARSGVIREHFERDWSLMPGTAGHVIEAGHHFEWAWLLLRWAGTARPDARSAAQRLMEIAEEYGVRDGMVVNSLLDDFSAHDAASRLWPQAERLKTAAFAARATGTTRYWVMVSAAAEALCLYLRRKVSGSWYDRRTPEGRFIEEPAPASSFYHIVGAIKELTAAIEHASAPMTFHGRPGAGVVG